MDLKRTPVLGHTVNKQTVMKQILKFTPVRHHPLYIGIYDSLNIVLNKARTGFENEKDRKTTTVTFKRVKAGMDACKLGGMVFDKRKFFKLPVPLTTFLSIKISFNDTAAGDD